MTVGKYNSINVDNVDQKEINSQLQGDTLIMGLDVAKKKEYAALGDETGSKFGVIRWKHPRESTEFARLVDELQYSQIQMVVEPTGTYVDPLRYLAYDRGWEVWRMGSKRVSDAKEIADGVPSMHDPKAAHLLLWLHNQGLANRWSPEKKSRRRVKTLTQQLARLQGGWLLRCYCGLPPLLRRSVFVLTGGRPSFSCSLLPPSRFRLTYGDHQSF